MLYKMRCPTCGSHFSRLDLRTQAETIHDGVSVREVEVVIGLCPECNSVLGVGGSIPGVSNSVSHRDVVSSRTNGA